MVEHAPRILVVEDEAHLASGLKLNLELEGFTCDLAATARDALAKLVGPAYQAIILDVMLPDLNGFELCTRLRDAGNRTPILMLTARNAAVDRVTGLDAGADDYLTKPFELSELLARIRSLLRRRAWDDQSDANAAGATLSFGKAKVSFARHEAVVAGRSVQLTQLEFDLLRYFAQNPERVIGRNELLEQVWKLRNYSNTRIVDNFIVRLRRHFEPDPGKPLYFVSVRGAGYKFVPTL